MRACDVNATRGCLDNRNSHQINKSMQIEYVCVQKLFYGVYNGRDVIIKPLLSACNNAHLCTYCVSPLL